MPKNNPLAYFSTEYNPFDAMVGRTTGVKTPMQPNKGGVIRRPIKNGGGELPMPPGPGGKDYGSVLPQLGGAMPPAWGPGGKRRGAGGQQTGTEVGNDVGIIWDDSRDVGDDVGIIFDPRPGTRPGAPTNPPSFEMSMNSSLNPNDPPIQIPQQPGGVARNTRGGPIDIGGGIARDTRGVLPQPQPGEPGPTDRRRGAGGQQTGDEIVTQPQIPPTGGGRRRGAGGQQTGTEPSPVEPGVAGPRRPNVTGGNPGGNMTQAEADAARQARGEARRTEAAKAAEAKANAAAGGQAAAGGPNAPTGQPGAQPQGNNFFDQVLSAVNPANKNAQDALARQMNHNAGVTGQINSGGYGATFGKAMGDLVNQQNAGVAGMAFQAQQADLDRILQREGFDVERYKADKNYAAQVNASSAAVRSAQIGANSALQRAKMDYNLGMVNADIGRENNLMDNLLGWYQLSPDILNQILRSDPFGTISGSMPPGDIVVKP